MQVYPPNSSVLCPEYVEKVSDALGMVKANVSTIFQSDFNAHAKNDVGVLMGVTGENDDAGIL